MATALGIGRIEVNEEYLKEVAAGLKDLGEDAPELTDPNADEALDAARKFVESQSATKEE